MATPLIHLFQTEENRYVYDVNSNDIFCIDEITYDTLHCLKTGIPTENIPDLLKDFYTSEEIHNTLNNVRQMQDNYVAYSDKRPEIINMFDCACGAKNRYEYFIESMTLEVTQQCNLACRYCCFSDAYSGNRNASLKEMSWDTAKASLDYIIEHGGSVAKPHLDAGASRDFALGFYGGEPLLRFNFIKKCVEYVKANNHIDRTIRYSLTTNGTLLNIEMLKWLFENDIHLVFSLDGPKEIHDRQRVTTQQYGTYEKVLNAIKMYNRYVDERAPGEPRRISVNCVLVGGADIREIVDYFSSMEHIFNSEYVECSVTFSGISDGVEIWNRQNPSIHLEAISGWKELMQEYEEACQNNVYNPAYERELSWKEKMLNGIGSRSLYFDVHGRTRFQMENECQLKDTYHPGSICVMGTKKCYVMADGRLLPCERVPTENPYFTIGHIHKNGIRVNETIQKVKEFSDVTEEDCKECWCMRMCSVGCSDGLIVDGKVDPQRKKNRCLRLREKRHDEMVNMMKLLEKNPHALDHYANITVI